MSIFDQLGTTASESVDGIDTQFVKKPITPEGMLEGIPVVMPSDPRLQNLHADNQTHHWEIKSNAKVKVFDLSKAEDMKLYQETWDKVAKGTAVVSAEERNWSATKEAYIVFLRWGELYYCVVDWRGKQC